MKTVCIIGGGLGGLMTGALLTREGYCVTVLEKNRSAGGGLQSFQRRGHWFDPCMHVFGGLQPGGNLRALLQHLGVADQIRTTEYHDTLVYNGQSLTLLYGREAWVEAVGEGRHREALRDYVEALYRLADTEDLFMLRPSDGRMPEVVRLTARELIARHVSDEGLRRRLAYIAHLYDGTDDSPALLHALTQVLHIDGIHALEPSAQELARLLVEVITAGGGTIKTGSKVTAMESEGRRVTAAVCGTECYQADYFVSAISIGALLGLVPQAAFSTAFRKRVEGAEQCFSAFCVYGILKPHTLRQTNACYHILREEASPWALAKVQPSQWPHNMFLITRSDRGNPQYADTLTLVAPMDFDCVASWSASTPGHRPAAYREWKARMTEQAMQMAREALGPIETEYLEAATPLTIRDYNGTTRGTCYGLHSSVQTLGQTTLSPRTRMENLYVTGQDVNFHGMVGTSLTAVLTAEAIVGRNVIVNQIVKEQKQTN